MKCTSIKDMFPQWRR